MFKSWWRAALVGALAVAGAGIVAPSARADTGTNSGDVGLAPSPSQPASGEWVIIEVRVTGKGNIGWGWTSNFTPPDGPFVWGQVSRWTVDGDSNTSNTAYNNGEDHQEVSTTHELGGSQVTLQESSTRFPGFVWYSTYGGAFSPGDILSQAVYVPGGNFSNVVLGQSFNADVHAYVGRGAGLVLGTGSHAHGAGAHALGVTGGDIRVRRTIPSGAIGAVLACTACRSTWRAPDGTHGGLLYAPAFGSADPLGTNGPAFVATTAPAGKWTFHFTGADVYVLGGRPVLAAYVDFGSRRSLFV